MLVKVDVRDLSGPELTSAKPANPSLQSEAQDTQPSDADTLVERIIAANLGTKLSAVGALDRKDDLIGRNTKVIAPTQLATRNAFETR